METYRDRDDGHARHRDSTVVLLEEGHHDCGDGSGSRGKVNGYDRDSGDCCAEGVGSDRAVTEGQDLTEVCHRQDCAAG